MDADMLGTLVTLANQTHVEGADELRRLVDSSDLVWGIWNDPAAEFGVGASIIKGEGSLEVIAHKREA